MDKNTNSADRQKSRRPTTSPPHIRPEEDIDDGLTARPDDALEAQGVVVDESVFNAEGNEADARKSGYIDDGEEPSPDNMMMNQ